MENRKKKRISAKLVFVILMMLSTILILLSVIAGDRIRIINDTIGSVLTPAQKGLNSVGRAVAGFFSDNKDKEQLMEENRQLESQIESLNAVIAENDRAMSEIDSMRQLLEMKDNFKEYNTVGASIISKDSGNWYDDFIIDKGTKDGIEKGMNVLSNNGLCGVIEEAYYNHSVVRSLIDDRSSVSAMSVNSGDLCFVNGSLEMREDGTLLVEMLTEAPKISEGDEIVTSYISDIYLPGIKIGYITEIPEQNGNIKTAILTPVADFEHLTMVLIITDQKSDILQKESGD